MSVYHDLDTITEIAKHNAKEHNANYNIILMNPDENGEFDKDKGSTYEFVADSYFNKERPNVILLAKTDDLLAEEQPTKPKEDPFDTTPRFIIENTYLDEIYDINRSLGMVRMYRGEPYVREGKKIGRNDPCTCGSGNKYKKCCG